MAIQWMIDELYAEFVRFKGELRAARLPDSSVRTFVDRSEQFLRRLVGDYPPRYGVTSAGFKRRAA